MKTRIIKDLIKRVVDYRIEGDYHVYTVKNITENGRGLQLIPEKLFLIITWEVVMAAMENI